MPSEDKPDIDELNQSGEVQNPNLNPQSFWSKTPPRWFQWLVWTLPLWWMALVTCTIIFTTWVGSLFGQDDSMLVPFEHILICICFISPYIMLIVLTSKCQWLNPYKSIGLAVLWYFGISSLVTWLTPYVVQISGPQ